MKKPTERVKTPGAEGPPDGAAAPQTQQPAEPQAPAPKPPLPLPPFFMLSHLEEDGPVRLDGVKLGVCEVMGLEIDEPKLGAFAGALNACDFPVQLLIRQHPPGLDRLREKLRETQPRNLPPQTRAAAESLGRLLTELEARDGILDRRFYAVCEFGRFDELRGLLARAGLSVHPLSGRRLRMLMLASALGGTPAEMDEDEPVEVEMRRREVRVGDRLVRSLHLGKWPRSLAPGFLQSLMAAGAPMDLSIHLGSIPAEQAARTLEWQKVRFESAQSLSFKRGRTMSPEAQIALEDVTRLRDEVQRGRERLFHSSLSITLHAKDEALLKEMTQRARAHFAATLGKLDDLAFRQREGILSTLPLALNAVAVWRTLDTSSLARLFPFSPPDLDTRRGTLYGIDMRACSPIVYDPWDGTHLNANTAVLARSGSGKSFATKLGVLRGLTRGVTAYVIDPEGAAFMVSMAKRARKHRLGLQFITQDVQDLLSEDSSRTITGHSGRALLQNAAFKLLLQQDAAAISTVGDAFDLPVDLQRWLLSCPRGDGLLLAKGHRFPVRIEATPEETAVIEWRPGRH